jgi:hypothetical protein
MPLQPPPYYSQICQGYGLQQALIFPVNPELIFALGPDDIQVEQADAGKSITIKYQSFTRDISASMTEFNITLYAVTQADLTIITNFARTDFLNNVRTTGRGSLALYYKGTELNSLYIQPPIKAPVSLFRNFEPNPTEVFDTVELRIVSPDPKWF